jgi:hypothetical protein
MSATTATVTPAAINPYSTALVTPANTTSEVLRGYRKIELATALPPEVSLKPITAKFAAKRFRAVKPGVSRNTTLAPAAAARAFYSAATGATRRISKGSISSRRYGNNKAPTRTSRLHSDNTSSSAVKPP